jgi:hypothetical protein
MKQVYEKMNNNKLRCKNCLYFSKATKPKPWNKDGNCINTDKIKLDTRETWSSDHEGATIGIHRYESHFGCKFFIWQD